MANERLPGISNTARKVEGPARIVGAAAIALGAAFAAEKTLDAASDSGSGRVYAAESINDSNRLHLENSQALDFRTVCVDPQGDEHPRTVDILKVEQAESGGRTYFKFTLLADPAMSNGRSSLKPDIGIGGAFVDTDGTSRHIFHAMGAQRENQTLVAVERLSRSVVIDQGPANVLRVEERVYEEAGAGNIVNEGNGVVIFSLPTEVMDRYGNRITFLTTEGEGHGNPNRNPLDQNKDVCPPEVQISSPTNTPRPGERPTVTPQLPLTPGAPEVLPPAPVAGLPTTGEGGPEEKDRIDADEGVILGSIVIGIGLAVAARSFVRRNRRRK